MAASFSQIEPYILQSESGGNNYTSAQNVNYPRSTASGYYQITNSTWAGIPTSITGGTQSAYQAPFATQQAAANYLWNANNGADWINFNPTVASANNAILAGGTPSTTISPTVSNLASSSDGGLTYTAPSDFAPSANTNGGYGSSPYGLLGYGNTSPYYDPTYIDPSGGAAIGQTQASGTAGSGAPVQLAFGQQLTQSVGGWVANTTNAVTGAIQGAASNWLLSLDNWFMRGIVMVVGLVLIILALRSVLEGTSVGEQARTAGRAARGGTRRAITAATAEV